MSDIDTKNAKRRALRFETVDDVLAEVERLVAAEREGWLRRTGNWTLGQTLGHLAAWIDYAYEGYPFRVPWFIRFFVRMRMRRYLRRGLDRGVRIPGVAGGTYGIEELSTEEGERRLRAALERLRSEPARYDSPVFYPLSEEDRLALNLRHAELHLGFLHPQ